MSTLDPDGSLYAESIRIYERQGQHGVQEWARRHHPELTWEVCLPCEAVTPGDGVDCFVCGTRRPDPAEVDTWQALTTLARTPSPLEEWLEAEIRQADTLGDRPRCRALQDVLQRLHSPALLLVSA